MPLYDIKQKKDLIRLKKNLKKKAEVENLDDINYQTNLEKIYKPLTEPLNKFVEEAHQTKKVMGDIQNTQKNLALEYKKTPLLAIDKIPIKTVNLGDIAVKYLSNAMKKNIYDTTYGLKPIEGSNQFKLGNKVVDIIGNHIKIDDKIYELGEEEWKLLTLKDPGGLKDYSETAWKNYYNIITHTKSFLREDGSLIWSKGNKYKNIIKFIYRQYMQDLAAKETERIKAVRQAQERRNSEPSGSGLNTIILPSNLNELVSRHRLLLASLKAGNTGVYNEIQAINDRLFEKGILNSDDVISFQNKFFQ